MKDLNFSKKYYKFHSVESKVKIGAISTQLDLEVMYKKIQ
jgi:hypothetical protein